MSHGSDLRITLRVAADLGECKRQTASSFGRSVGAPRAQRPSSTADFSNLGDSDQHDPPRTVAVTCSDVADDVVEALGRGLVQLPPAAARDAVAAIPSYAGGTAGVSAVKRLMVWAQAAQAAGVHLEAK
jgi:hypothetical protein